MKIGIYGSIDVGDVINHDLDYIGVDNGVSHLLKYGIKPVLLMGDLDSLEDRSIIEEYNIELFPTHKDDTDTALAIKKAINDGYDEIDLYGVTHKRLDHFMAVIYTMKKYHDIRITIYDEYNKIYILNKGKHKIYKDGYTYFSLFSFKDTYVSLNHCEYPLKHYLLKEDDPLCCSNQMHDALDIEISDMVLMIQSS